MNNLIRRIHRWLSAAFTLTIAAYIAVSAAGGGSAPPQALVYAPLLPLFLLLLTGWFLFVLPYVAKWRSGRKGA